MSAMRVRLTPAVDCVAIVHLWHGTEDGVDGEKLEQALSGAAYRGFARLQL